MDECGNCMHGEQWHDGPNGECEALEGGDVCECEEYEAVTQ